MGYSTLSTYQYRNLKDQEVSLDASSVFLVGENGQGKSNFLEALYLLSYGSSFRTKSDTELITHGHREMSIHGSYLQSLQIGRDGNPADKVPGTVSVVLRGKEKTLSLNGKKITDRKDLVSTMPSIVFTHDDLYIVSGPPDMRRWFFNQTMSLLDPPSIDLLRTYRKILKMRNIALKEGQSTLLSAYDLQLAERGFELQSRRSALIEEFSRLFTPLFAEVSGIEEPLTIEYRPSWSGCENPEDAVSRLEERRNQDIELGTTTSGPHRDRFLFRYRGADFTKSASTGQLRLISLLLRTGQCRCFNEETGRKPVLLLDDVLLELDGRRRERFLARLPEYEQAFFTFLPDEQYTGLSGDTTRIYYVEDGWIRTP
ncbi:MAG: DNA replication/repair protein RecF [Spirochaetaceae bacterium]